MSNNIVIEVTGGVVTDVHGLPEGYTFEIADWDDVECGDVEEETVTKMIESAKQEVESESGFFIVSRLHRDDFEAQGYDASGLTDDQMRHIASKMGDSFCAIGGFWDNVDYFGDDYKLPKIEPKDE